MKRLTGKKTDRQEGVKTFAHFSPTNITTIFGAKSAAEPCPPVSNYPLRYLCVFAIFQ